MLFPFLKPTDQQLIEGIREGGSRRRQFESRLFEKYHYFVKEGVRKHQISTDDSISAYSDTILVAIDAILQGRFEGRSELKTYLHQIFSNKCVDVIRKNTTNKASVHQGVSYQEVEISLPDESKNIIQQLLIESELKILYQKLDKIGDKCREIMLMWGESYSDDEIAAKLAFKSAAVAKTTRFRCMEKLKNV